MKLPTITIRQKMLVYILGTTIPIFIFALIYVGVQFRNSAIEEAQNLANSYATIKANNVQSELEQYLIVFQALSMTLSELSQEPEKVRLDGMRDLFQKTLIKYPEFDNIWVSWDRSVVDKSWDKFHGQRVEAFVPDGEQLKESQYNLDLEKASDSYFYQIKESRLERIAEPYILDKNNRTDLGDFQVLGSSPIVPILDKDGIFLGIIGADMLMDDFQSIASFDHIPNSQAMLVSHMGLLVAHQDQDLIGQYIDTLFFIDDNYLNSSKQITSSESGVRSNSINTGEGEQYVASATINLGASSRPWSIIVVIPKAEMTTKIDQVLLVVVLAGMLGLGFLTLVVFNISGGISKSISKSNTILQRLASGDLNFEGRDFHLDNSTDMKTMSDAMRYLEVALKKKTEFSDKIRKGLLYDTYQKESEFDVLGASLIDMRGNLQNIISETNLVIKEASLNGKLSIRINTDRKEGAWAEMAVSINELLNSILQPVITMGKVMNAMAEGNLKVRFEEAVEGDLKKLTDDLNDANYQMSGLLLQVQEKTGTVEDSTKEIIHVSTEMNTNTSEIASAVAQMSVGAQNQVRQVDESSRLMETILSSANKISDQSTKIKDAASQSEISSKDGQQLANKAHEKIEDISRLSKNADESIRGLGESSKKISRALSIINELSVQTNLLSLNAAIEAAQAGESGRGFTVVADEIRKLAEDAKNQTKEIERLVRDIQSDSLKVAEAINVMNRSISDGSSASKASFEVFSKIIDATSLTKQLSELIVADAVKQKTGIGDVVSIIESVVVIAEQTAAGTEEVASSATELSSGMETYNHKVEMMGKIASELKAQMSHFKLG